VLAVVFCPVVSQQRDFQDHLLITFASRQDWTTISAPSPKISRPRRR